jgi:hypothetical protein
MVTSKCYLRQTEMVKYDQSRNYYFMQQEGGYLFCGAVYKLL